MGIINKIIHKTETFYKQNVVCEQYPMLTFFNRKKLQAGGAMGLVYMLHHITEKDHRRIPTNEDLKVSPAFLDKLISLYKKKGFNFISLDELSEIISSEKKLEQPFISFTIDDGYLDNYTQALPVFERQQVPFTIFVATDFIDQKAILWWDILEELVLQHDQLEVGNSAYPCRTFQEKWDTFRILREQILSFDQRHLVDALNDTFTNYNIDWYQPVKEKAMSWEQVRQLSHHPLCTIGGHTVSHPAFNRLSDDEFRFEVSEGIKKIEDATGKKVQHFAYPYGSPNEIGEREYRLISEFKFKTVFSSYGGCISENNKHQTTHLPRVYLHER